MRNITDNLDNFNYIKEILFKLIINQDKNTYLENLFNNKLSLEIKEKLALDANNLLHEASKYGNLDAVKILISNGFDINMQNTNGLTALHFAVINCHTTLTRFLLNNESILIDLKDNQSYTPLHRALLKGDISISLALIIKGADLSSLDKKKRSCSYLLNDFIKHKKDILLKFQPDNLQEIIFKKILLDYPNIIFDKQSHSQTFTDKLLQTAKEINDTTISVTIG